jgi:ribosomal protein S18 acetylase RimI-like enzyme
VEAVQTRQARSGLIDVRPLAPDELEIVERLLPRYAGRHSDRLKLQHRGYGVYLIAWHGSEPVGHLNLRLGGRKLSERGRRAGAAEIEDLSVAVAHRRSGIGTTLMRQAQAHADQRGFRVLGLAVAIDNEPARRLYAKEGYEESGYGELVVSYPYLDEQGNERMARETCTYLIKRWD